MHAARSRRCRQETGVHAIEGVAPFLHACYAGVEFEEIWFSRILLASARAQRLIRYKRREGVRTFHVKPDRFRRISSSARASGVLAIARQRWFDLAALDPDAGLGRLVVENVRSSGNLGTMLRTAEAAGIAGVVLLDERCDPYDVSCVRASMGALFDLEVTRTTHAAFATWARVNDVTVIGTSPRARVAYTNLPDHPRQAVLVGDEREGLTDSGFDLCDVSVRIPVVGRGDSLNVGVATGITLYARLAAREGVSTGTPCCPPAGMLPTREG